VLAEEEQREAVEALADAFGDESPHFCFPASRRLADPAPALRLYEREPESVVAFGLERMGWAGWLTPKASKLQRAAHCAEALKTGQTDLSSALLAVLATASPIDTYQASAGLEKSDVDVQYCVVWTMSNGAPDGIDGEFFP